MISKKLTRPTLPLVLAIALSLALVIMVVTSGSAAPPAGDEEFTIIADSSNALLNSQPVTYISADDLMALLDDNNDGVIDTNDNPDNDPLVIDVRSATDYATLGHIPGAINIPYKNIDSPANLATIRSELAKHCNKTIVLACYTGHTDKLSEMGLGAVAQADYFGSPAPTVTALKWGNLGWNTASESTHLPSYTNNFTIETTPNPLPAPSTYPLIDNTTSTEPAEIVRVAMDNYLSTLGTPMIVAGTGAGQVNDTNISSYTVVDLRSNTEYNSGHIPGAINIPYQQLFANDANGDYPSLLAIDRSKPIIVYSSAQQEANAASVALNALGIRNANANTKSLRWGLAGWNSNYGTKFINLPASSSGDQRSYPTVSGSAPGGLSYTCSCTAGMPDLRMSAPSPFWASYADYQNGLLSVNWTISNVAGGTAYDVKITGSFNSNGVTIVTPLPVTVANIISVGGNASVTLKYNVPVAVGSWHTDMTGSATDLCGNSYYYGQPPA
jgi:rhodanese-related sulfurtransferase